MGRQRGPLLKFTAYEILVWEGRINTNWRGGNSQLDEDLCGEMVSEISQWMNQPIPTEARTMWIQAFRRPTSITTTLLVEVSYEPQKLVLGKPGGPGLWSVETHQDLRTTLAPWAPKWSPQNRCPSSLLHIALWWAP